MKTPSRTRIAGTPQWARPSFTGGFAGSAFTLQADGTLRCPADRPLYPPERRPERDGSLRVSYAARIGHCRPCVLSVKSAVLWPIESASSDVSPSLAVPPAAFPLAPLRGKDWPRCGIRQAWRSETVRLPRSATAAAVATETSAVFTRAQRAHWRLSWQQRNARPADASALTVTLHGLPATLAQALGFDLLTTA